MKIHSLSSNFFLLQEQCNMELFINRFFIAGATEHPAKQYMELGIKGLAKEIENWPEVDPR